MNFSIRFTENVKDNGFVSHGKIEIGEFKEIFEVPLTFWSKKDYLTQWEEGLQRIVGEETTSCLITSMHDPQIANFIVLWPLYRNDSIVMVHNNLLFLKELNDKFEAENPYIHIPKRMMTNEEGCKISEWTTNVEAIQTFLRYNKSLPQN